MACIKRTVHRTSLSLIASLLTGLLTGISWLLFWVKYLFKDYLHLTWSGTVMGGVKIISYLTRWRQEEEPLVGLTWLNRIRGRSYLAKQRHMRESKVGFP